MKVVPFAKGDVMLIVRYLKNGHVFDLEVDFNNVHKVYKKIKKRNKYAEIIFVENGREHHVW